MRRAWGFGEQKIMENRRLWRARDYGEQEMRGQNIRKAGDEKNRRLGGAGNEV